MSPETTATQVLLNQWRDGSDTARDALIERLLPELEQIAFARLRADRGASISAGDLVNEAVLRLITSDAVVVESRGHLMALASRVMRNILVDHARSKAANKRRHDSVTLTEDLVGDKSIDLIKLNVALTRLAAIDPDLGSLIEMRFFGGMTFEEVGAVLRMSEATAKRRWFVARAWLADALGGVAGDD